MWKPLFIDTIAHPEMALEELTAEAMEKLGATDIKVLYCDESFLHAVVYVTPEYSRGSGRES